MTKGKNEASSEQHINVAIKDVGRYITGLRNIVALLGDIDRDKTIEPGIREGARIGMSVAQILLGDIRHAWKDQLARGDNREL